ncbi:MAG: LuxR C-terminal-related transcriptional regulator, partial [Synergistaceae bacterium]|nr:LuxR C-terminal-related transcriptional regulator [Synergistaceae bacterium]
MLERPRLKKLLAEAIKSRTVFVTAGAGYGKTLAVYSFLQDYDATTVWIQLSERDNLGTRFWENVVRSIALHDELFAARLEEVGFPETDDQFEKYLSISKDEQLLLPGKYVIVFDDFHLLKERPVLRFLERAIQSRSPFPSLTSFLISRTEPDINVVSLISKGLVFSIGEEDLRLTESETSQYFQLLNIPLSSQSVSNICEDTAGWILAIHLVALSLKKSPAHDQSARIAMKLNIFKMIESEVFMVISDKLRRFLIKLSLVDHLSVELVLILAGGDETLLAELDKVTSFVRRDIYSQTYLIHHLFLDYLRQKQDDLTQDEKRDTYLKAARWCDENDYKIDAISYFDKIGDYEAIVGIAYNFLSQIPYDHAQFILDIYDKAPTEELEKIAVYHSQRSRLLVSLKRYDEAIADIEARIEKYSALPSTAFTNRIICGVYTNLGMVRYLMAPHTDRYDFDEAFEKGDYRYRLTPYPVSGPVTSISLDAWASKVGTARKGAMEECIEALSRSIPHVSNVLSGNMYGLDDLARGELYFYKGDLKNASTFFNQALYKSHERNQYEVRNRSLFYLLRIGVARGNYEEVQKLFKSLEAQLEMKEYISRFITFDIVSSWYFSVMRQPQLIAGWILDDFAKSSMNTFKEIFGNFVKAKLFYANKKHHELLSFLENEKTFCAVLFGKLEMKVLEAACLYQSKKRDAARGAFREAYDMALPNDLEMPFIEIGNDMRTLTRAAMRDNANDIPREWLERINRKAATYAKRELLVVSEYRKANNLGHDLHLSPREIEILHDVYHGLTRSEIAVSHDLSISTVKMVLSSIYSKLG